MTGSGEIVSWAISPSVPSGLAFSTSTGVLSGTPTELLTRTMFTITATNTGGTATAYINITIVDEVPTIAYSPNDLDMTNNTASSDLPLSPTSDRFRRDCQLGHQSISAKRPGLQHFHWRAQWNADRIADT